MSIAENLDPSILIALAVGLLPGLLIGYLLCRVQQAAAMERARESFQHRINEINESRLGLEIRLQSAVEQVEQVQGELESQRDVQANLQRQYGERGETIAALQTRLEQERRIGDEKLQELKVAREQLSRDFELLANRIFDEKTQRFNQHSKDTLDRTLAPLREQLTDFRKKVEDVYEKDSRDRISLAAQLTHLKELNQQMSEDALNLTRALKGDNKAQGNWGEVILERVLEESGLHKGREYETQVSFGSSRPDVVVRLPENKDIVIDAKVSLVAYERYCNADDEELREQAMREHVTSVREHIRSLSLKSYEDIPGLRTLDFVFIFIPIESAFMAAFENDQAMFREAYEKNIIVVGPTTLLATLRTVQSIWRYERQNKNAEEIARQAGAMHDKFVNFVGDLENVALYLDRASKAQADAMNKLSLGTGNLVSRTIRLEKLGAKVKKSMPSSLKSEDSAQALEELDDDSFIAVDETEDQ